MQQPQNTTKPSSSPPLMGSPAGRLAADLARAKRAASGGVLMAGRSYRGTVEQRASGRLEVVDAPDAGEGADPNATIRRAQVRDPIRRGVRKGHLRYRHFLAAEKFRNDLARAESPGRLGSQFGALITVDGGTGVNAPDLIGSAMHAKERSRRAWEAMGLRLCGIVAWCVVPKPEGMGGRRFGTIDGYAECNRIRRQTAGDMLEAALTKLADHYGLGDPSPPKDFA